MKLKEPFLIILILLILFLCIGSVSALENQTADSGKNEVLSISESPEILTAGEGTYSDLRNEINSGGNINLNKSYYRYTNGDGQTIQINTSGVINGNGAVIDMAGSSYRAFYVNVSKVTIKNLTIKNANYNGDGGAIYFSQSGTVENCNFTNNTATGDGGAIKFENRGTLTNCNFVDNKATGKSSNGGAVDMFYSDVIKCNFTNNIARYGGAVNTGNSTVKNCNFINCTADYAGAIYVGNGRVETCNFINNHATSYAGAIYMSTEYVKNCNFINNSAKLEAGAVLMRFRGEVIHCNFINNSANKGGAMSIYSSRMENCNFTGNNATSGSAIYCCDEYADYLGDSTILNNKANAESLEATQNEFKMIFTFTGKNNHLNAIYTEAGFQSDNVIYWGANGITNTNRYNPPKSNKEAGQTIIIEIYDSAEVLVDNVTLVTDNNGQVEYDFFRLIDGTYNYTAYHPEDSYYTGIKRSGTFTVDLGNFGSFTRLQNYINSTDENSIINLSCDYTFTEGSDEHLKNGIVIDKPLTINGNGHVINALQKARIFNVTANNVVLNNISFVNGNSAEGGAVYFNSTGTVTNCNFTGNNATGNGGAIQISSGSVENCNFINNTATEGGGSIYFKNEGEVTNCNFTDNSANYGGAIFIYSGNVSNCNFTRNTISNGDGGAVYMYLGNVTNCNFANNLAFNGEGGAGFFIWSNCNLMNCNFTNNSARYTGGAVYLNSGSFEYCNFVNNSAGNNGGAVYCYDTCNVTFSNFMDNYADYGSAFYFVIGASSKIFSNTCFLNNKAKVDEKSALKAIKNGTNIEITFSGHDNHLNAIYSNGQVICTNVTYWSACGINNTGSSPVISAKSDEEAGQNITVKGVVNGRIINTTEVTDENGMVVLEDASDYWIIVSHNDDSYYTKAGETIFTNIELYVNVTSLTTSNRTVNLTAKSNIYNEVMPGKLLFILPDGTPINATYSTNGTWWTVHKFEDYNVYHVNASYVGLDNVTVNNGTVTITRANSTIILDDIVLNYGESINVTVTTEGATAITAKIDENDVEVNNFTIPISGLGVGNYTLTVTTIPDKDHVSVNKTVKITVNKASVEIILTNETLDLKINETVSDFAHLIPADAGTLNYTSSNSTVVVVENSKIKALAPGTANITVSFAGNDQYAAENQTIEVTVSLTQASWYYLTPIDALALDGAEISLYIGDNFPDCYAEDDKGFLSENQSVTIEFNETCIIETSTGPVGDFYVNLSDVNPGTYTVTFSSPGYTTATATVTINKLYTYIDVDNTTLKLEIGKEVDSGATLTPADAGNLTYTSSNESVAVVVDSKIKAIAAGTATITVSFAENDRYYAAVNQTIEVTVTLNDASVSVNNETVNLKVDGNFTIVPTTVPEGLNVTYVPDESGVYSVDENGVVTALKEGTGSIIVKVGGDGIYAENTTTITVTVSKIPTEIIVQNNTWYMEVGDIAEGNATLTPADAGNLTYGSMSPSVIKVENDKLVAVAEGKATVVIIFDGNDKYSPANSIFVTVIVSKVPTEINIANATVDMEVTDEVATGAALTPADAGNVTYTVSNSSVVKVEDGKIIALAEGSAVINVSFDGDDKYATAENKTIEVTVNLKDASVTANDITLTIGENATIDAATTPEGLTIDYVIDDSGVVTVENGVVTAVKAGTAKITLNVGDDEVYAKNSTTITVTVNKIDTSIVVENKTLELYVYEEGHIVATLNPDGGDLNFTSSDDSVVTVDNFGDFKAVAEGTATITVSFAGDDKYNAAENVTVTVKVSKIDTSIEFNYDTINLKVHNETIVTANLNPPEAGNVTYTSSNPSVVTVDNEGNVKAVGAGNATITASFAGNDKYNEAENVTVPVIVSKIDTKITVDTASLDLNVGNETTVKGTLTPAEAGKVSYMSNDTSVVTVDENTGKVTAVGAGNACIIVFYDGNDDYNMADDVTIPVTVSKIDTSIAVKDKVDMKVDDSVNLNATLTPADAGNVTYTSSNPSVVTVDKKGNVVAVSEGTATVTVSFAGDDKYAAAENVTVSVSVAPKGKENATISIDAPSEATEGDNVTVTVTLPEDATGTVTIGNETVPIVNGTASAVLTNLPAGNTTVPITYSGDDKYNPIETEVTVTVKEDTTDIIKAPDVTKYYKGSERFVVTVTDYKGNPLANKTVEININGVEYTRTTDANGTAGMAIGLPSNVYNVTVIVDNQTVTAVITVLPTVDGSDVVKIYRNGTQYYATFLDSEGKYLADGTTVQFNINGIIYNRKVSGDKGLAKLNINLPVGEYIITAMNPQTGENAANNITVLPTIVENRDITKYYKNATQYTVKVFGADGKPVGAGETVTFNINGVLYKRTTDESGIAKININLAPGEYIITAEYKGFTVSNNIKVLPVLSAKDITMKYRDGTQFKATLVDGQGKPYADQTVTFNINGVFYNRPTDSTGTAKLNINLMSGEYIITSSYNGANIANKITIRG